MKMTEDYAREPRARSFDDNQFKDGACLYNVPSARYTRANSSDSETVNFGVTSNTDDGSTQCKKKKVQNKVLFYKQLWKD
jgi:hypothetical protein